MGRPSSFAAIIEGVKSWIEISRANLVHNLRAVQSLAGSDVETLAVIKANGYGHDATVTAQILSEAGIHWLGVTDAEEGVRVRSAVGWSKPAILVMSGSEPVDEDMDAERRNERPDFVQHRMARPQITESDATDQRQRDDGGDKVLPERHAGRDRLDRQLRV